MKYLLYLSLFLFTVSCSSPASTDYEANRTYHIAFNLPETAHVYIWLENAYHTKMKTILDEELPKGTHAIQIIMEDENGNKYPEGIYNVHIKTKDYSKSTTLIFAPFYSRL
jgi:hypothetical protein